MGNLIGLDQLPLEPGEYKFHKEGDKQYSETNSYFVAMPWPQVFGILGHIYALNQDVIEVTKTRAVAEWVESYLCDYVRSDTVPSHEVNKAIERILVSIYQRDEDSSDQSDYSNNPHKIESISLSDDENEADKPSKIVIEKIHALMEPDNHSPRQNLNIYFGDNVGPYACFSNNFERKILFKNQQYNSINDFFIHNPKASKNIAVIKELVRIKFHEDEDMKLILLATEQKSLINQCADDFWGTGENDKGLNNLGKILMAIRMELIKETLVDDI